MNGYDCKFSPSDATGMSCAGVPARRARYAYGRVSVQRRKQLAAQPPLRRSWFTLIELLTVMAIIAVLATLLMTALASAKKKSRQAYCTSNLHQISLALNMYLDDFEKRPPSFEELVATKNLTYPEVFLCPEDKTRNWGGLVQGGDFLQSLAAPPLDTPPAG